jgi:hypothetical protein
MFNLGHALEAHRPLGSIMRVRTKVYIQAQDFRQQANGVVPAEPRSTLRYQTKSCLTWSGG